MSEPARYGRVIVVADPASEAAAALVEQLRQQGLEADLLAPEHLPDRARAAVRAGVPPTVCVFMDGERTPPALVRDLRAAWEAVHLMFVAAAVSVSRLRRDLSRTPGIGADTVVFGDDDQALAAQIVLADNVARRRRKLRTTLDRANRQLATSRPVDGVGVRRMLIAERYLDSFLEQADDAIIGLDADARVLYWNQSAAAMFGLTASQATGLLSHQLPFWSPAVDDAISALRGGGTRVSEEIVFDAAAGRSLLDVVFSPVLDDGGSLIGLLLIARDASLRHGRQEAEREVSRALTERAEEERRRLEMLFESAPGFMAVTMGPQHVFEMVNRAYLETLGDRALLARSVDSAFPDLAEQPFRRLRDQVYASGEAFIGRAYPVLVQRHAGNGVEQRYLDFVYQPILGRDGAIIGIFCQGSDVTEQKLMHDRLLQHQDELERMVAERSGELHQAQLALQQSQKLEAIGKLTGGVAHDFNNILQVVGSNLELLAQQHADHPATQSRIDSALGAVERGARLAADLLAFARRQPLQPVATSVARVMRDMDDLLRRALGEAVEVEMVFGGGLWSALVDRNQLENVLLNLAINARDAMEGAGHLTIEASNTMLDHQYVQNHAEVAAGQYVMLAISDTGCGMPPEVLAQAFEPFYTTKREGHGTGLGLSMAYGFVKQSGGHIKIYSEPGSGTTVKIYLPRSFQAEVEISLPRSGPVPGGSETVLVVEDDAAVQAVVVDQLAGLGYTVLRASDAQAALNVLQSGVAVDLLFTDVVMPGPLRSVDLARQAKQMLPRLGVLFTSGYTQNAIVHGGRLDVGVELLSKPYLREDLARRVRKVLDQRPADPEEAAPAKPASLRILVVEDNLDAMEMMCEMLGMMGHEARGVVNAEEALNFLDKIDVLLSDIHLPGMSGPDLAREALKRDPPPTVVFVSGGSLPQGLEFPARLLKKPFTMEQLSQLLSQASPD